MLPRCSVIGEGGWGLNVCCMYLNVLFTYVQGFKSTEISITDDFTDIKYMRYHKVLYTYVREVKSLKIHITDDFTDIIKYITGS